VHSHHHQTAHYSSHVRSCCRRPPSRPSQPFGLTSLADPRRSAWPRGQGALWPWRQARCARGGRRCVHPEIGRARRDGGWDGGRDGRSGKSACWLVRQLVCSDLKEEDGHTGISIARAITGTRKKKRHVVSQSGLARRPEISPNTHPQISGCLWHWRRDADMLSCSLVRGVMRRRRRGGQSPPRP
jgi:hypothetical protein